MALKSPIFDKIMNDMNSNSKLASVDGIVKQGTLANTENMFDTNSPIPIIEAPQMGDPDTLPSNPNPTINGQSSGPKDLSEYKSNEGFSNKVYKDSKGIETIGYGHKLTNADKASGKYANGISTRQAEDLLAADVASHSKSMYKAMPWINDQPQHVQEVLEDMNFNMGTTGLSKFNNMLKSIKSGDYNTASKHMLDSNYSKDVGDRATRNANKLKR